MSSIYLICGSLSVIKNIFTTLNIVYITENKNLFIFQFLDKQICLTSYLNSLNSLSIIIPSYEHVHRKGNRVNVHDQNHIFIYNKNKATAY